MNTKLLTVLLTFGMLLGASGVASATALKAIAVADVSDIVIVKPLPGSGCTSPNVPDCIDLAAALAKWASDTAGELACDILCD